MYKAVLFDFNGTLFQDSSFNEEAWLEFADSYAGKQLTAEEFQENVHGKNNRLVLEYLFDRPFEKEEAIEWGEKKEDIYREKVRQHPQKAKLTPGAITFLNLLKEKNVPRTIATASGKGNIDFYFDIFQLANWFDYEKVVYDNGERKSKPNPEIFQLAAHQIGTHPQETIIFEDSHSGLRAAKNAGANKIFAIVTENNQEELAELEIADEIVIDFSDTRVLNLFE